LKRQLELALRLISALFAPEEKDHTPDISQRHDQHRNS